MGAAPDAGLLLLIEASWWTRLSAALARKARSSAKFMGWFPLASVPSSPPEELLLGVPDLLSVCPLSPPPERLPMNQLLSNPCHASYKGISSFRLLPVSNTYLHHSNLWNYRKAKSDAHQQIWCNISRSAGHVLMSMTLNFNHILHMYPWLNLFIKQGRSAERMTYTYGLIPKIWQVVLRECKGVVYINMCNI